MVFYIILAGFAVFDVFAIAWVIRQWIIVRRENKQEVQHGSH